MNPDQYCQEKSAASGSSFYYSFLFLPVERRRAIMALYAFCREVDDIVDECHDISIASTKLTWWRQEVERIASGQPTHPVGLALQALNGRFNLPKEQLLEIIDGMEMDLQQSRYLDFKGLSLYCYRVASVVGLRCFAPNSMPKRPPTSGKRYGWVCLSVMGALPKPSVRG